MGILMLMAGAAAVLLLGARLYAPLLGRVLGERRDRPTPAVLRNDGRDFVPTPTPVVFAHHYASIAGAGPIVGPVLAIYYGWGPALLWILIGGVFLGAAHDYLATHIAIREGGRNIAVVTRRYLGGAAFAMMLILLVAMLALVCAAFLDLSARALTSMVPAELLKLPADQTLFRTDAATGKVVIGGIASTSVVVITAFSPLLGFLYIKRRVSVWLCSLLALVVCALSIVVGLYYPMAVTPDTWKGLLSAYVLLAAGVPVWLFLQSRDFINVHILYAGIAMLVVALVAAALRGGGEFGAGTALPMENLAEGTKKLGPAWPILFVTVACGAISGFHSLCAGGTTCKQLSNELAARRVGYYAMLLESFLAVCVVCCLIVGLSSSMYQHFCYPAAGDPNAVLTFAMAVGNTMHVGFGLPVAAGALGAMLLLEGFLVTTLDTAIRLTRYMIEEGWALLFGRYDVFAEHADMPATPAVQGVGSGGVGAASAAAVAAVAAAGAPARGAGVPTRGLGRLGLRALRLYWVNSGLAVGLMLLLGVGGGYEVVWKIFGSSNQLLAALTLLVGSAWLLAHGRPVWYTLVPAVFMLVTAVTAAVMLFNEQVARGKEGLPLAITTGVVLAMTLGMLVAGIMQLRRRRLVAAAA